MPAAGKVCTGYSLPWIGVYNPATDAYSSQQQLGRGVSVELSIEEADSNDFYADNVKAETARGKFGSGSGTATIDGLFQASEKVVYGLPTADADGFLNYDDDGDVPFVGFGYIKRYMSDGATTYNAVVLRKVKFKIFGDSAATQEEDIDWQTQALEFDIFRADDAKHTWRRIGADQTTEAAALADLKKALGVTP